MSLLSVVFQLNRLFTPFIPYSFALSHPFKTKDFTQTLNIINNIEK